MPGIALRSSFSARGLGAFATQPNWFSFSKIDTDPGNNFYQTVAIDSSGNVYTYGLSVNGASTNGILSKVSTSGTLAWTKIVFDSGITTSPNAALATDSSGNVYLVAEPTAGITLFKFDSSGTLLWQNTIFPSGTSGIIGKLATDSANIYFSYYYLDGANFVSAAMKFDFSGNLSWQKKITGGRPSQTSLTVDASGNIFFCESGRYDNSTRRSFLSKLDSSGALVWQVRSSIGLTSAGVVLDSNGNIYVASHGYLPPFTSGLSVPYLQKFDSSGVATAIHLLQLSSLNHVVTSLAIDSSNNLYVGGYVTITSSPSKIVGFIAKYSTALAVQWVTTLDCNPDTKFNQVLPVQSDVIAVGKVSASAVFANVNRVPASGKSTGIYLVNTSIGPLTPNYGSATIVQSSAGTYTWASTTSLAAVSSSATFSSASFATSSTSLITYVAQV